MTAVYRAAEVARLLDVSVWTVQAMARAGRIRRVPGIRALRIPVSEVERLLGGEYARQDGESDGKASTQEAPSRRRHGRAPPGSNLRGKRP